ncbi:ATP-binding protein [Planococcus sp. X10-3]|uniref:ATP-binding protein n=1 Tax=Planococcus sp. X10-3 TaxID=3061240 RepID=UPI003BAF95D4
MLKDSEDKLGIADVATAPVNWSFMPVSKDIIHLGFSEKNLWIEFFVEDVDNDIEWLLVLPHPSVREATLYTSLATGGYAEEIARSHISSSGSGLSTNDVIFDLNMQNADTFYLNVQADGPLQLPISIWEKSAYENSITTSLVVMGILLGMAMIISAFYIYLFYSKRQLIYLYFLLFALSLLGTISVMSNYSVIQLVPFLIPASQHVMLIAMGLANIFGLLYIGAIFEKMKKDTKLKLVFNYTTLAVIIIMLFQFISFAFASISIYFISFITLMNILYLTATSRKYEQPYLKFHLVSFIFLLISLVQYGVLHLAWVPLTDYYETTLTLSVIAGIIFSAIALAAKEKGRAAELVKRDKKTMQKLQFEVESLRQADARKNELLEVTSHSLRTPLYGMIGIAEKLMEESVTRLNENQTKQLDLIVNHGKRLAQKITDITDFSRIKQNILDIHVEPVSINRLLDEVLEVCRPLLKGTEIRLYETLPQNLPDALADPYRTQQILYNLIDNAIKHTEQGEIVVSAKRSDNQLAITVRDTGCGIDAERLKYLFDPMNQRENKSSGIGLHISKRLIELHGGWLKAESVKGEGTTFTFTLPVYNEEIIESDREDYNMIEEISMEELTESLSSRLKSSKKVRVLVVEKEPIDRSILISQLQKENYTAVGTGAGSEALKIMETEQIDIVILDWDLEDMSGNELCRKIRQKFILTEVPILMLSTKVDVKEKMDAFSSGANDYLIKPCDKEEFLLRVDTLANLRSLTQEITNMNYVLERNVKEKTMALEITNMNLITVNDEIQEIEKSRNEMLSSISHELGTPITLIHSYIQAVKESLIDEKNPRYLDMIHKKLVLLERLTEDLVELGKYKSGNMTLRFDSLNFGEWLERLIIAMEADISQSGRIFEYIYSEERIEDCGDYYVSIDNDRMDQVFSNVLWNAVKNTSSVDGKITVSSEIHLIAENEQDPEDGGGQGEILIKISDTGYGIPEEVLPHIFDRFFKIDNKSEKKGSGLGLAIAKEIVQSHNGRIWAESEVGVGSSFFIALPLYKSG